MSEISRREMLKMAGLGVVSSEETKPSLKEFSLQNVAARISLDDKEEHKNGWFGSMFGAGIIGLVVSSILLFMILKNPEYKQYFWHLTAFVAVIAFLLIKDSIDKDKKGLVADSLFDDLYYLINSFSSKFDSRYESVSFIIGSFYMNYKKEGGFIVFKHDNIKFLSPDDYENFVILDSVHHLRVLDNIAFIKTRENVSRFHFDTHMLIRGKNYHNLLLSNRKELRKAINKLLESSDVVYVNDMTYICVAKWKLKPRLVAVLKI